MIASHSDIIRKPLYFSHDLYMSDKLINNEYKGLEFKTFFNIK